VIEVPVEMLAKREPARRLPRVLANPHVRVALVTAAALAVMAVVARRVLDVELGFYALLAPFFVFTAYKVSGQRGRTAELIASAAVVMTAAVVLLAYAL
jgi:hypothetical protein